MALETANILGDTVKRLIIYEMPVIVDATREPITPEYWATIEADVAAGNNPGAVKKFMKSVGVPPFFIWLMPYMMGAAWKKITGIAPTLMYDEAFVGQYQQGKPLPTARWNDVTARVLVADGGKSPEWMRNGQTALARVLRSEKRTLNGQTHIVKADAQAPMIRSFFQEP
ncbi:MAG: hypothetical protein WDN31_12000 [Hyphomicrobium sp.]